MIELADWKNKLVQAALREGVTFVCATCPKLWWGRERGLDHCQAAHEKKPCCGPFGGMAYPEYSGPLKGNLTAVCFLCGNDPDAAVDVDGKGLVGICEKHVGTLEEFSPPGVPPAFVRRTTLPLIQG